MSEFNNLKLDVENEIAVLTISRPAALNALNSETLDELNTALTEIEGRDDIKVVILTGGPDKKDNAFKSFVAGADIAEMVNFTAPEARAFGIRASVPFFKLMNMRQVTIAAVNGFALGGGCEIAWHVTSVLHLTMQSSVSRNVDLESFWIRRYTETCPLSWYGTCQRMDLHMR